MTAVAMSRAVGSTVPYRNAVLKRGHHGKVFVQVVNGPFAECASVRDAVAWVDRANRPLRATA